MYRFLVRLQFLILAVIYGLVTYKLWTKSYDNRFCTDFMIFNCISFFWFVHLIAIGIILVIAYMAVKKINPRSLIFQEIVAVATICIFLILTEIYFRLKPAALPLDVLMTLGFKEESVYVKAKLSYSDKFNYNDDRELIKILKPNLSCDLKTPEYAYHFCTDSFGFQNFYDKTLYTHADIVTVGDSFTQGVGVPGDFSYPRQLAKILNARVLNLGHEGYDCYQFPIVLKRFGLKAHAKIVIMSLWTWNDIQPRYNQWYKYCATHDYMPIDDYYAAIRAKQLKKGAATKVKKYYLYLSPYLEYLKEEIGKLFFKYQAVWNYGPYRGIKVNGKWFKWPITDGIKFGGEGLEAGLEYLGDTMVEFKNLSQKYGFRPLVVFFPPKQLIYSYFIKGYSSQQKNTEEMDRAIITKVKENNIEILDMTPVFIHAISQGVMPYHAVDEHLNKEGYAITARALADYLRNTSKNIK